MKYEVRRGTDGGRRATGDGRERGDGASGGRFWAAFHIGSWERSRGRGCEVHSDIVHSPQSTVRCESAAQGAIGSGGRLDIYDSAKAITAGRRPRRACAVPEGWCLVASLLVSAPYLVSGVRCLASGVWRLASSGVRFWRPALPVDYMPVDYMPVLVADLQHAPAITRSSVRYSCNLLQTVGRVPGKRGRSSARTGSKRPLLPARQPACSQLAPSLLPGADPNAPQACSPPTPATELQPHLPSIATRATCMQPAACELLPVCCFPYPCSSQAPKRPPHLDQLHRAVDGGEEAGGAGASGQPAQHHAMSAEPGNYTYYIQLSR